MQSGAVQASVSAVVKTLTNLRTAQGIAPEGVKVITQALGKLEKAGVVESGAVEVVTKLFEELDHVTGVEKDAFFSRLWKLVAMATEARVPIESRRILRPHGY